jgi:hypothetical protein
MATLEGESEPTRTPLEKLYAEGYELIDIAEEAKRQGDIVNTERMEALAHTALRAAHDKNPLLRLDTTNPTQ